jgi:hypothetical protein
MRKDWRTPLLMSIYEDKINCQLTELMSKKEKLYFENSLIYDDFSRDPTWQMYGG